MNPLFAGIIGRTFEIPENNPFYHTARFLIIGQITCIVICGCVLILEIVVNAYKIPWLKEIRNILMLAKLTKSITVDTHERTIQTLEKVDQRMEKVEQTVSEIPKTLIESKPDTSVVVPQKIEIEVKKDG